MAFMSDGEWREAKDIAEKINVPSITMGWWLTRNDNKFEKRWLKKNKEYRLYDRWHIGQENKSEWFNILREAGPVTTTATPTQDLFNISYSNKKKRKENDEDVA